MPQTHTHEHTRLTRYLHIHVLHAKVSHVSQLHVPTRWWLEAHSFVSWPARCKDGSLSLVCCFSHLDFHGFFPEDWFIQIFWNCDLMISFLTGYYDAGTLVTSLPKIAVHYAKTWLLFDVSLLSMDWAFRFMDTWRIADAADGSPNASHAQTFKKSQKDFVERHIFRRKKTHNVMLRSNTLRLT